MTQPRLLLFDPMALLSTAARQGGARLVGDTHAWLVALGRTGAVERHALCASDANTARTWFAAPGIEGLAGGVGLLACADRVYATGGESHAGAWHAVLRHALREAQVAPAQALLIGGPLCLAAARAMSLPAQGVDCPGAAIAWAETRLRQRYGASPGALGVGWGRGLRRASEPPTKARRVAV